MTDRFNTTVAGIKAGKLTRNGRLYSSEVLEAVCDEARRRIQERRMMIHEGDQRPPSLVSAIGVVRGVEIDSLAENLVLSGEIFDRPNGQANPLRDSANLDRIYCSMIGQVETRNGVVVVTEATLEYLYIPEEEE